MSNSAQHKFSLIPEVTYGTTPATPAFSIKNITGTTLGLAKGILETETIRSDRQVNDVRHGTRQVGGEISVELNYGDFDDFLEATLCGTWARRVPVKTAATLSAAAADNSINDSANGLPIYIVGEQVTISGFTGTVGNNQVGTVVTSTISKLVVTTTTPLVNDAAGESVSLTLPASLLVPGSTRRSYSGLRQFTDLGEAATPFHLHKGLEFNTLSLELGTEAFVKATFGMLGREITYSGTAPADTTYVDAGTNKVFDSFTGFLKVDDVEVAEVTECSLSLENGLEPRFVLFDDKTQRPKIGRTRVTGSLTLYFLTAEFLAAFNGGLKKALEVQLEDVDGNTLTFLLPSILGTGGQPDVQGESDITITYPFTAVYEDGEATPNALQITRVPA